MANLFNWYLYTLLSKLKTEIITLSLNVNNKTLQDVYKHLIQISTMYWADNIEIA